jgi:two-component system response regulator DctR
MPGLDGISIVQAIRRQDRLVPIIVLTVDERQEIADQFLESGANDFANKPIKVADLAARIKVHLNIRQQLDCFMRDKGINNGTLEIVDSCSRKMQRPFFAEEVVDASGLAYQTVVRYLQYLEDQKIIKATSHYGKVGRPKKRYQYIDTPIL